MIDAAAPAGLDAVDRGEGGHRYRAVFDATSIALVVTDPNLMVVDANPAAARLLGIDPRFLVGKPFATYIDPPHRRSFRRWFVRTRASSAGSLALTMRNRAGVPFSAAVDAVFGASEIYWTVVDQTAEIQTAERLWELNRDVEVRVAEQVGERETLLEQLPVGVALVRSDGQLGWHNAQAEAICGAELEPALGSAAVAGALAGGTAGTSRVTLGHGGGPTVEIRAAPLVGGGAAVVIEDVTVRDHVDRANAEFVQNAAHQLRTPVAAIASSVAALEAGAGDDAAERRRFLLHVSQSSERLSRIVDALLTLASLERGTGRGLVEVVTLRPLLDEVVGRLAPAAEIDCPRDVAMLADRDLLAQALGNVVANAVEHAGADGVRVRAELHGNAVRIEVADSGPGIPSALREQVFERFFRAPGAARTGSGLGLPIARAAVAASGGRLELLPAPAGEGATFRFTLPGARRL